MITYKWRMVGSPDGKWERYTGYDTKRGLADTMILADFNGYRITRSYFIADADGTNIERFELELTLEIKRSN